MNTLGNKSPERLVEAFQAEMLKAIPAVSTACGSLGLLIFKDFLDTKCVKRRLIGKDSWGRNRGSFVAGGVPYSDKIVPA